MSNTVGDKRESLERWAAVIKGWTGKGWFEGNIEGMLDYYNRGEIPGENKNGAKHGANKKRNTDDKARDPEKSKRLQQYANALK